LASKYRRWWAIFKEKCRISPEETDRLSLPTHPKARARGDWWVSRLLKTGFSSLRSHMKVPPFFQTHKFEKSSKV
jgi:hypothetical protein